jgi:hypothetical protein
LERLRIMPTDTTDDAPTKRIDGVERLDGFEGYAADRLVEQWSQKYRQRNPDKLKSSGEIEQAIPPASPTGGPMPSRRSKHQSFMAGAKASKGMDGQRVGTAEYSRMNAY